MFSCKLNRLLSISFAVDILFSIPALQPEQKDTSSPCSLPGWSVRKTSAQPFRLKISETTSVRTSCNTLASFRHLVIPEFTHNHLSFLKNCSIGFLNKSRQDEGMLRYSYPKIWKKITTTYLTINALKIKYT